MSRQEFFNQMAKKWDTRFHSEALRAFLTQFVPTFGLKPGQKVLDIGTGTGILIPYLLKEVGPTGKIFAIDYAEKMAERCSSKYCHIPNLTVSVQQVENLIFPLNTFDAVTCFGMFPHIEQKELALQQINKVLKIKGSLIIAHALSRAEINKHHQNGSPIIAQDMLPKTDAMKELLKNAGFGKNFILDKLGKYLNISIKLRELTEK